MFQRSCVVALLLLAAPAVLVGQSINRVEVSIYEDPEIPKPMDEDVTIQILRGGTAVGQRKISHKEWIETNALDQLPYLEERTRQQLESIRTREGLERLLPTLKNAPLLDPGAGLRTNLQAFSRIDVEPENISPESKTQLEKARSDAEELMDTLKASALDLEADPVFDMLDNTKQALRKYSQTVQSPKLTRLSEQQGKYDELFVRKFIVELNRPIPLVHSNTAKIRIKSSKDEESTKKGWRFTVQVVGFLTDDAASRTEEVTTFDLTTTTSGDTVKREGTKTKATSPIRPSLPRASSGSFESEIERNLLSGKLRERTRRDSRKEFTTVRDKKDVTRFRFVRIVHSMSEVKWPKTEGRKKPDPKKVMKVLKLFTTKIEENTTEERVLEIRYKLVNGDWIASEAVSEVSTKPDTRAELLPRTLNPAIVGGPREPLGSGLSAGDEKRSPVAYEYPFHTIY